MLPPSPAHRLTIALQDYLESNTGMRWDYSSDLHGPDPIDPSNPNPCGWVQVTRRTNDRAAIGQQTPGLIRVVFRIVASHASASRVQVELLDREWELEGLLLRLPQDGLPNWGAISVTAAETGATFVPRQTEATQANSTIAIVTGFAWREFTFRL